MALPIPGDPEHALASTYDRFHLLERNAGGWSDLGPIDGYDDIGGSFQFDRHGYIWFTHFRKGIYRLSLNLDGRRFDEAKLYTLDDGLPNTHDNSVAIIDGEAVFSTDEGFFRLNSRTGRLVADKKLNDALQSRSKCKLYQLPDNIIMVLNNSGMEFGRIRKDGTIVMDTLSPVGGADLLIPGSESATFLSPNSLVISNQEGFWNIDPQARSAAPPHVPFVNTIHANRDSVVYAASPARISPTRLILSHDLNSLRFDFAFTDYRNNGDIEFSSFLENYDEDWTPFSSDSSREYTRLADGDYVFHLRARDPVTGHVSESGFSLRITPPWYRTTTAKIIYILLAIAAAYASYLWVRRWFRRSQQRLVLRKEKELQELRLAAEREALKKDFEIASLKSEQLEHDVRHKSNELSNTTMNLIRKNEILTDIAEHINKIREQLKSEDAAPQTQKQLSKILTAIRENISHDDDWKNFTHNFDIVYENFTRRLGELHPNLTPADQRLCCYIRMRLSSKEIAPLINISFKSVEMARYRLRKKMGLPPETSLTEYLSTITD